MVWASKCHRKIPPVVCNHYVKYEEVEVDRLAIMEDDRKTSVGHYSFYFKKAAKRPF